MEKMRKRAIMWFLMLIAGIVTSYFLDLYLGLSSLGMYSKIIGITIIIFSSLLLRASGKALKQFGMRTKKGFGETDTLVTSGIYGCIRHPHHTGIALFILGFGFLIGLPAFLLFVVPVFWVVIYLFVKRVEEPEAIKKFGEAYIEYSKKVPSFIPKMNCFWGKRTE